MPVVPLTVNAMRSLTRAALVLPVFALTACGGSDGGSGGGPGGGEAPGPQAQPQVQPGATLLASVGTAADPEAYEIALTTEDGKALSAVAAGTYTLVINDPSQTHNFHLFGSGVEVSTDVRGTGKKTVEVTFTAGTYDFTCDPHPSMSGAIRAV